MTLAVTFYDLVLSVHILAVVVAFGVVFAYPVIDTQLKRAQPNDLASLHRLHLRGSARRSRSSSCCSASSAPC